MMQSVKNVSIEILTASHAKIISSIVGWKCIALSWWRAKILAGTPFFQWNWFSESCLDHDFSGTSWGQWWLLCGMGRVSQGDSGSWIPGVETGCTGSASCTKLSQWSNYWKWSVTSGEVPELQSDLGSQWSMPCTSSPLLHSPTQPSAANTSLVTSRGARCCFWLKMQCIMLVIKTNFSAGFPQALQQGGID